MTCLGFTSSTERGSIALFHRNKMIQLASWTQEKQPSDIVISKIKSGLSRKKIAFSDLKLIAVDKGPGSFTGSRIAVNIAKTLAYSLNIPIVPCSSLDILAFGFSSNINPKKPFHLFTLIDAHKSLFYFRSFQKDADKLIEALGPIQALSLGEIEKLTPLSGSLVLLGNLPKQTLLNLKKNISSYRPQLAITIPTKIKVHFPQALSLVEMALELPPKSYKTWFEAEPSYIRSPL